MLAGLGKVCLISGERRKLTSTGSNGRRMKIGGQVGGGEGGEGRDVEAEGQGLLKNTSFSFFFF